LVFVGPSALFSWFWQGLNWWHLADVVLSSLTEVQQID
jgi:hypothetical protein